MRILQNIGCMILIMIMLGACLKQDYSKISSELIYRPDVSVPLGKSLFSFSKPIDTSLIVFIPQQIQIIDTIPYDPITVFQNLELVNELRYRIYIESIYPAQIQVEAFYMGANNEILGSLTKGEILELEPSMVNQSGVLLQKSILLKDIYLNNAEVLALERVKRLNVVVHFYDVTKDVLANILAYEVTVHIGVQAKMAILYQ